MGSTPMKTIEQIRMQNFLILLQECETQIGRRGAAALLSRKTTVPAPFVSQLRNNVINRSGSPRTIGDDTARKLEAGMHKQEGWMDQDHSLARNADEASLLDLLRGLTPWQLKHIVGTAEEFAGLNASVRMASKPPDDPRPTRRPRQH